MNANACIVPVTINILSMRKEVHRPTNGPAMFRKRAGRCCPLVSAPAASGGGGADLNSAASDETGAAARKVEKVRKGGVILKDTLGSTIFYADTLEPASGNTSLVQPIPTPPRLPGAHKSHRVMQYNMWKRVSPSNPMSSHPHSLSFALKHSKSVGRTPTLPRNFLYVFSQVSVRDC
ncbi:hypothetical protein K0M31_015334 [Melipona bicolor]|uniref:Uncharacterized protein n=1 Tax=Melipona bicolor TaxID=60889 RepID=A0AA40KF93_9HYME|nr:hypothetical protein K0M31_015334 [Melipona bicolor]